MVAALLSAVGLSATGCGTSSPGDTYSLSAPMVSQGAVAGRGRQLLIADPVALKTLDSDGIVIQVSPREYQYLGDSRWSDSLTKVVQLKLAQAFENSGRVAGAGLPGEGLAIDYQIQTNIHAFQIDVASNTATVEIAVRVLNDRHGTVRARNVFRSTVNVGGSSNKAYVDALDRAFSQVSSEIVGWSLKYI